jgi:hypothetical protein
MQMTFKTIAESSKTNISKLAAMQPIGIISMPQI